MIANISLLIFILSPFIFIAFLIKPALLNNAIKKDLSRKKIAGLFAGVVFTSFTSFAIFTEPVSAPQEIKIENKSDFESKVLGDFDQDSEPLLTPNPLPSPSPSSSLEPTSIPTPVLKPTPVPSPTLAPTKKPTPIPTLAPTKAPATIAPTSQPTSPPSTSQPTSASYSCNCSKTCPNMSSCAEAQYQLNVCGCSRRDGDNDGVPCESICPGG